MPGSSFHHGLANGWGQDTIYSEATCNNPEDVFYQGSDDEDYENETARRLRYEEAGRRFLAGQSPLLFTAALKGPFETAWTNPWKSNRRTTGNPVPQTTKTGTTNGRKSVRHEPRKPKHLDAPQCHLPSPESLKQVSVEEHPYLEEKDIARVQKWRATVEPSEAGHDDFWTEAAQSPSNARASALKDASRHDWLNPSNKRKSTVGVDPAETPRKRRQQTVPASSIRTPQGSTRSFKNKNMASIRLSTKQGPRKGVSFDQDEDELMDGVEASFSSQQSRRLGSPTKRLSPRRALRTVNAQDSVESEDELAHDKTAEKKAAATLSSPMSNDGPVRSTAAAGRASPCPIRSDKEEVVAEEGQLDAHMVDDDDSDTTETSTNDDIAQAASPGAGTETNADEDIVETASPEDEPVQEDLVPASHDGPALGAPIEEPADHPVETPAEHIEEPKIDKPRIHLVRPSSPLSSIASMGSIAESEASLGDSASDAASIHQDVSSELSSAPDTDDQVEDVIRDVIRVVVAESETDQDEPIFEEDVQQASDEDLIMDDNSSDGSLTDASDLEDAIQDVDHELIEGSLTLNSIIAEVGQSRDSSPTEACSPDPEAEIEAQLSQDTAAAAATKEPSLDDEEPIEAQVEEPTLEVEPGENDEPNTPAPYVDAQSTADDQEEPAMDEALPVVEEQVQEPTAEPTVLQEPKQEYPATDSASSSFSLKGIFQQFVPWGRSSVSEKHEAVVPADDATAPQAEEVLPTVEPEHEETPAVEPEQPEEDVPAPETEQAEHNVPSMASEETTAVESRQEAETTVPAGNQPSEEPTRMDETADENNTEASIAPPDADDDRSRDAALDSAGAGESVPPTSLTSDDPSSNAQDVSPISQDQPDDITAANQDQPEDMTMTNIQDGPGFSNPQPEPAAVVAPIDEPFQLPVTNERPSTPQPIPIPASTPSIFPWQPFSAFMTPSPEHRARKTRRSLPGGKQIVSVLKDPTAAKSTKRVSWAPLPGEWEDKPKETADEPKNQRPASPPPSAPVEELSTYADADFGGHFNAMAKRAGEMPLGNRNANSIYASQESDRPSSPPVFTLHKPFSGPMFDDAANENDDVDMSGPGDEFDMTDQVFDDLQGLLRPWDLDAELDQARRENDPDSVWEI